jgi:predicted peptidase
VIRTLLALFALTPLVAGGETGFLDRSIAMAGQVFRYQVYVPLEHTAVAEWPVLVDLHGDGSQGSDGIHQTRRGIADAIRSKRSSYPTLVLFPQAQSGTSFSFTEMQDLVSAELEQTRKEFHGDPKRIYLIGFSMGGSGVYRLAHRWPDRFAAIVPIAGAVVPPTSIPAKVVKADQQANPFVSAPDPYAALAERIASIPIWIFHGEADQAISVENSRRMSEALITAGAAIRYTEYGETDHVGTAAKAYADPELIRWLLAQHR